MSTYTRGASSPSEQPSPDPALLATAQGHNDNEDDTKKVNVVSGATYPSETFVPQTTPRSKSRGTYLWQVTKQLLFRPGVAGGLVGLVNVGLLSGMGYVLYTKPHLRRDNIAISSAVGGALLLVGAEGYATENLKHHKTWRGQEECRAPEKRTLIYKHLHEQMLCPGVLSGLVGLVNAGIVGMVGYFSYINWDKPKWDRNIVTAVSVSLLTLWGGESYLAERCRERRGTSSD
ncbi:hypothetical protein BU15DRAFT_90899 [Melanogaster broomeanus]|nr:hypothetical protein BU15DRAFT_90899 [Melanogaster broomeanus]